MRFRLSLFLTFTLLICSCENIEFNDGLTGCDGWAIFWNDIPIKEKRMFSLFLAPKYRLDCAVKDCYDKWKKEGKDTTKFVVDFAEIAPFEWDTLCYFLYSPPADENTSKMLIEYAKEHNMRSLEAIHLLKDGKIVYHIDLAMWSDEEKGSLFCTNKDMIKRARNDAKFHVQKKKQFFIFRDMTEEYVPSLKYVDEYEE
jgi:hypothetical protein